MTVMTDGYADLRALYAAMKDAEWRYLHGSPPFGADSGPSDAPPEEIIENSRSFLVDRSRWIDDQRDESARLERELMRALQVHNIQRDWWDAYAEGNASAPTCHACYIAIHRDAIHCDAIHR